MDDVILSLVDFKDVIGAVQSLLTMLALLLGGAWAYFKFVKGRVFVTRLEPSLEGRIVRQDGLQLAIVEIGIKNVGLSRVDLNRKLSSIEICGYPPGNYFPEFHNALVDRIGVTQAVTLHEWIEPGEFISEQHLLALPPEPLVALKLKLTILQARPRDWPFELLQWAKTRLKLAFLNPKPSKWALGVEWNAVAFVTQDPPPQAPVAPPAPAGRVRTPAAGAAKSRASRP